MLKITQEIHDAIISHAKEGFPLEVCGILGGRDGAVSAIYHSHPETPARPSAEDIRLGLTPDVSYVIVSLAEPDRPVLKSFKIDAGTVQPEEWALT